jgi:ubiquinone biosynthesis protein
MCPPAARRRADLGKPSHDISIARPLAQLLRHRAVRDAVRAAAPLQAEDRDGRGTGTRLNPKVNIWELARPPIEADAQHGPRARWPRCRRSGAGPAPPAPADRQLPSWPSTSGQAERAGISGPSPAAFVAAGLAEIIAVPPWSPPSRLVD